ncbi:hypothetical protein [Thalassotalea ganghwensis]
MTASINTIKATHFAQSTAPELANVDEIDSAGRIKSVNLQDYQTKQPIIGQARHVTTSTQGELVLVQYTKQGWVVIAQLAEQNSFPAAYISDSNGHVQISGAKSVSLTTEKGSVEIHQNGRIVLDGSEVNACSEKDFFISGWPIRLN